VGRTPVVRGRRGAAAGDQAAPWLCVTGTNGKTTTTGMTASILRAAGLGGLAVGNIGAPAVQAVTQTGPPAPPSQTKNRGSRRFAGSRPPSRSADERIGSDAVGRMFR